MKQTAVEYLIDQLLPKALTAEQYYHIVQAKAMEKEQHKKTWSEGMFCETGDIQAFEQYYNKNFKTAN
jgi:hypothetical protein